MKAREDVKGTVEEKWRKGRSYHYINSLVNGQAMTMDEGGELLQSWKIIFLLFLSQII